MKQKEALCDKYFKDSANGVVLVSGLALPKDPDGKVRDKRFVRCMFHPNCEEVEFINCDFVDCEGEQNLNVIHKA